MLQKKMLNKHVKILVCSIVCCLYCFGCTIAPKAVSSFRPTYDASTPFQYDPYNSGLLYYDKDGCAVITKNARDRYNLQIQQFQARLKREKSVVLTPDAGIFFFIDKYGNGVYKIDPQHLQYFIIMTAWIRSGIYL